MEIVNIDTNIDTVGLRIECIDKNNRNEIFNILIDFINNFKLVAIEYDNFSNKFYQKTNLLSSGTKIATISKGYYKQQYNYINPDYYYINIDFYGLKRYSHIDDISIFILTNITALLNTYNIIFFITELDIAIDIKDDINNIQVACMKRSPQTEYIPLGNNSQLYESTYYIEQFSTSKQKRNAISRSYYYNKTHKELLKYNNYIENTTRFEIKLQKRFFVNNEYSISSFQRILDKYSILIFHNQLIKNNFINQFNKADTSRKRHRVVNKLNNNILSFQPDLLNVIHFLQMLDTVKFNIFSEIYYNQNDNYDFYNSKFNNKWRQKNNK